MKARSVLGFHFSPITHQDFCKIRCKWIATEVTIKLFLGVLDASATSHGSSQFLRQDSLLGRRQRGWGQLQAGQKVPGGSW